MPGPSWAQFEPPRHCDGHQLSGWQSQHLSDLRLRHFIRDEFSKFERNTTNAPESIDASQRRLSIQLYELTRRFVYDPRFLRPHAAPEQLGCAWARDGNFSRALPIYGLRWRH